MIAPSLPAELKVALDRKADGLSRSDAARRASMMSETYRSGGNSSPIRTETDALAYALTRMPATYAAVAAGLNALREQHPAFAPQTLLDVGAGPGTASWAAAQTFETIETFNAFDANASLRSLALDLFSDNHRLSSLHYEQGEALTAIRNASPSDLVIASYMINELEDERRRALTDLMWEKTRDVLLVVEPGTPAGYTRILALRAQLTTKDAHVIAPCPHDRACPLTPPDWCHFSQRLSRSRAHRQLKGADAPFEDERFIYVALSRTPVAAHPSRVLSQPVITKVAVTSKLCTNDGIKVATAPKRDKAAYAEARRWNWGDAVPQLTTPDSGINLEDWSSNR